MTKYHSAEKALLGCAILQPTVIDSLALTEEHFKDDKHRRIFAALVDVRPPGEPRCDMFALVSRLEAMEDLEKIGGVEELARICKFVPNVAHAMHYFEIITSQSGTSFPEY